VRISRGAPKVQVSTTDRQITAHAGAVLLRATADAIGLGPAIEAQLHLKVRERGLSEAESILGIAEAVAAGAKCLDDLEVARADRVQEELRGFGVPPPQTAGRFLRRFCLGHIGQLNKALRNVLLRALSLVGCGEAVTLDFDSTYIRSRSSRRQGADRTYLKRYALHPLMCFVAESGICLHAKLRRGSAHTAKGLLPFVDECLRRVPGSVPVRARFDSGFHDGKIFEALERRGVTYLCGVALNARILGVIREIGDWAWSACLDKDEGEVAEFGYRQADSKVFRRYVVKRIPRNVGEQLDLESGVYNYWVLVTNDHTADAAVLESEHRHKALVESGMRELKENFGLEVLRKHQFMANWAWLLIVVTAHNLIRLTQLLGAVEPGADLRGKRFRYRYLIVPGLLVRTGRRLLLRLDRHYPLFDRFVAAHARLCSLAPAGP
jgi:hypothetical protein